MVEKKKMPKVKKQDKEISRLLKEAELFDRETAEAEPDRRPLGFRLSNPTPERDIGQRIQDARRKAGLTQNELAQRTQLLDSEGTGVSRGALSLYEIGKNAPPAKELRLLCEALKVSPNRLIYGVDDPFDDFADRSRYRFTSAGDPHLFAQVVYRISQLEHQDRRTILKLIDSLLFAKNPNFEAGEAAHANDELLNMADQLRAKLSKP